MGSGIFTRYAKQTICGLLLVFAGIAALFVWSYGPAGGASPYETVNDLYDWAYMSFTADQSVYPAEVATVTLTFRNDAPDGAVVLASHSVAQWCLERETGGRWRSLRAVRPEPCWRFRPEDCTLYSTPSGVVDWNGGEFIWHCDVGEWYPGPLEPGRYRIVIPDCEHLRDTADLAVEFEVV